MDMKPVYNILRVCVPFMVIFGLLFGPEAGVGAMVVGCVAVIAHQVISSSRPARKKVVRRPAKAKAKSNEPHVPSSAVWSGKAATAEQSARK